MTLARCEAIYAKLRYLFEGIQDALISDALEHATRGSGTGARRKGRRTHSDASEEWIPTAPVGEDDDDDTPQYLQQELF